MLKKIMQNKIISTQTKTRTTLLIVFIIVSLIAYGYTTGDVGVPIRSTWWTNYLEQEYQKELPLKGYHSNSPPQEEEFKYGDGHFLKDECDFYTMHTLFHKREEARGNLEVLKELDQLFEQKCMRCKRRPPTVSPPMESAWGQPTKYPVSKQNSTPIGWLDENMYQKKFNYGDVMLQAVFGYSIGFFGLVISRKDIVTLLLYTELMFINLILMYGASGVFLEINELQQHALLIMVVAATETSVILAILLVANQTFKSVKITKFTQLKH